MEEIDLEMVSVHQNQVLLVQIVLHKNNWYFGYQTVGHSGCQVEPQMLD
jgi:hypothetical protein